MDSSFRPQNPFDIALSREDVTVEIAGKRYRFWDDIEIYLSLDTQATVSFAAPFEPERKEFRQTFRPFSFQPLEVSVGGTILFTGTLVDVTPRVEASARTVAVAGYSKPAVLDDSDVPARIAPFQFNGLTMRQIAERLASPFEIGVVVVGKGGGAFKRVAAEPGQSVMSFLAELAQQRGYVLSSTPDGRLLLWQSVSGGRPVARLIEGEAPLLSVHPTFSPQHYFSEITGYCSARRGRKGSRYTERNRWLSSPLRCMSFRLDDTEKGDVHFAVRSKMGRMFGNMVSYVVTVPTWLDPQGELWQPNTTVSLVAPSAMVYDEYEFLIRDVHLRQDSMSTTARLGLVLPGAFSGEQPAELPWE